MGTSRVVVTGAAGALGGVVATHFLMAGHPVVLVDRDEAALRQAYADTPGDMAFVAVDLTNGAATRTPTATPWTTRATTSATTTTCPTTCSRRSSMRR